MRHSGAAMPRKVVISFANCSELASSLDVTNLTTMQPSRGDPGAGLNRQKSTRPPLLISTRSDPAVEGCGDVRPTPFAADARWSSYLPSISELTRPLKSDHLMLPAPGASALHTFHKPDYSNILSCCGCCILSVKPMPSVTDLN